MTRFLASLRSRLMASHLVVILIGATTLVVMFELLAPAYFEGNVRTVNEMMMDGDMMMDEGMMRSGDMMTDREMASFQSSQGFLTPTVEQALHDAFDRSIRQALVVALLVSAAAGLVIASFASGRILAPLESIRGATRRMASGSYAVRVDPPVETELAAVAEDVNALAEALDETEQQRVRLISEVAHELRTPLATIEGYLEGILDGVFEPAPEILAVWEREVRRLKRLTHDLSTLSRVEEAPETLDLQSVDIAKVVAEVVEQLRPRFDSKEIAVQVDVDTPVLVMGDRDRLLQVVLNIVSNALAYTPPGGSVTVEARREGSQAVVRVTDTGRGLTAEEQTRIFERFYRADRDGPGGSGIGLTIARSIARRHGGDITAESPGLGQGSTFTIELPA